MKIGDNIEITGEDIQYLFVSIFKLFSQRVIPRNKRDKIGIIIAISAETPKEKIRLQNDLILELKGYLKSSDFTPNFNVISLSENHVNRISDYETALKYLKKIRGHFIVYGNISERMVNGEPNFVFRLNGIVVHRRISQIQKVQFAKEFAEVMPRRWRFPESKELFGFDITQQSLGCIIKYIVGIAAYVSGDFDLAYKIYMQLENELSKERMKQILPTKKIKERLAIRLTEASTAISRRLYFSYKKTKKLNYIEKMKKYLDLLQGISPNDYGTHLLRAIYIFLIDKNIDAAKNEVKKVRNPPDPTWRYSLAFLYAYKGELEKSRKEYNKAFKGSVPPHVIGDVEIFISDVLEKEPHKYQLYFVSGYINYKVKNDFVLAKKDFNTFIEQASKEKYQEEIRLAKIYIEEMGN